MDRQILEDVFVFASMMVVTGCVTGIIITWIRRKSRNDLPSSQLMNRLSDISDRLARVDGSIDTIAVEVERISEAQRFTAKVLAERAPAAAIADKSRPAGSTTPH